MIFSMSHSRSLFVFIFCLEAVLNICFFLFGLSNYGFKSKPIANFESLLYDVKPIENTAIPIMIDLKFLIIVLN